MKINYIRASTSNAFDSCQFQYFLLYDIGVSSESNRKAAIGTLAHRVLEVLAKSKKTSQKNTIKPYGKRTSIEWLLQICTKKIQEETKIIFTEEELVFCRKQIDNALSVDYLNPLNLNIVSIEHQFEIEVKKPEFKIGRGKYLKLKGTIDLLFEEDSETIHILDYKTGKSTDWVTGKEKDAEKLKTDTQLRMYDLAVKILFPKYKYRIFTLFFTQEIKPITVCFEENTWKETLEEIRAKCRKIESTKLPTRLYDLNSGQRWKCQYVCQFGKLAVKYQSKDGQKHTEYFRNTKNLIIPDQVLIDNVTYFLLPGNPESHCEKLYNRMQRIGDEEFRKELVPLTINSNVSKRNNFEHDKLDRKTIK